MYPTNGRHPCTHVYYSPLHPTRQERVEASCCSRGINLSSEYPEPLRCDAECCAPVLAYYAKNASLRQGLK